MKTHNIQKLPFFEGYLYLSMILKMGAQIAPCSNCPMGAIRAIFEGLLHITQGRYKLGYPIKTFGF